MIASRVPLKSKEKPLYHTNNMNKYFTMLAVAMLGATTTQAETKTETFWAHGVSAEGGWYDANKTHDDDGIDNGWSMTYPNDPSGNGAKTDDNMCYAASAANLLAWWQAQYEPVAGVPQGVNSIWQTMVANSTLDAGGNMPGAVQWWLTGQDNDRYTYLADRETGYYSEYTTGRTLYDKEHGGCFIESITNPTGAQLIEALEKGKGVSLTASYKQERHAITLWGLEHTDGIISKIWITDSDDYTMVPELTALTVEGKDGAYTLKFGEDDEKIYTITTAYTINPGISDEWGLVKSTGGDSVPEPTTATLSLLALGALAMRRRRH